MDNTRLKSPQGLTVSEIASYRSTTVDAVQAKARRNKTIQQKISDKEISYKFRKDEVIPVDIINILYPEFDFAPSSSNNKKKAISQPLVTTNYKKIKKVRQNIPWHQSSTWWKNFLSIIPLPMLGLAASWGVYHFASQFVPTPMAIIEACAFECVYIGISVGGKLPKNIKGLGFWIAAGAAITSILYNTFSAALMKEPTLLDNLDPLWFWIICVLHGLPIAGLAFGVSILNFHKK